MITVDALSKNYGQHEVLHALSFGIKKGEIVGLLGPNGAGKSTLLKVLSGYLAPTAGSFTIDGRDFLEHSLELRARLGYLPEHVPLYPEMTVSEYLRYRAALKKVRRRRITEKVVDVLDLCALHTVEKKLIGTLSKGYRQRVGLADALVNEPDLLLLDEPTVGLDPAQQREINALISNLAKRHTLLISTHHLHEAETFCHRFLILHQSSIVGDGTLKQLQAQAHMPHGTTLEGVFSAMTRQR